MSMFFATIAAASERKASRRREVAASAPIKDHVERVAAQYLKHHRARVRPSTFRETARVMAKEILPHWRGRRLSEITRQDVRGLIDRIAKRGAPISANRTLSSLKAFCNWCVSEDILKRKSRQGLPGRRAEFLPE
jgi:site-specific recombinase XerD